MNIRSAFLPWLLVGSLSVPVGAQEPEPKPAEKSAETPAEAAPAEAEQLIEQLGDSSYRIRNQAEERLRELGDAVLPALRKAAEEHADAEVQWRAGRLVRQIEGGEQPGSGQGLRERRRGDRDGPGFRRLEPRDWLTPPEDLSRMFDDLFRRLERDFDVDIPRHGFYQDEFFQDLQTQMQELRDRMKDLEAGRFEDFGAGQGRSFSMQVGPDGVSVEIVHQDENGRKRTETYEAPDLETFREKYPEIAERYLDNPAGERGFALGPRLRWFRGPEVIERWLPPPGEVEADGPRLGVLVAELDAEALGELGVKADKGLQVERVVPGSLAERLGIEPKDIVLEVGGAAVGTPEDVREALSAAGDEVEVRVHRDGAARVLKGEKASGSASDGALEPRKSRRRAG